MKKVHTVILAIIFLSLVYFSLQQLTKTKAPIYQTAKVERGTIISSVTASGQIAAANSLAVTTQASGIVKEVFVSNGTQITAGDKILELTLDSQSLQKTMASWAAYLSAQNTLNTAQANINSLQSKLFKAHQAFVNGKGTEDPDTDDPTYIQQRADWLQAEADYKNQAAVISQAKVAVSSAWQSYQLVSAIVVAPIAGTVSDLIYAKGMSVMVNTTTQKIATIKNTGKPIAQFDLSELDVNKVKSGQNATVELDAFPGKKFVGKVIGVDTSGVISTGVTNYPVTIQLDTILSTLLSNMAANATIVIDEKKEVLTVPSAAIKEQDNKTFAQVRRNGKIQQIPVVTGLTSDTETEIIEGISVGEEVITGVIVGGGQSPFSTGGLRPGGFGGQRR